MNSGGNAELLNVLGDVKARVQERLGSVEFPMPAFILVGKQSVGKSRLIETLAGEPFNFISGTLGSRRPTVLEFRSAKNLETSKWYVRNPGQLTWEEKAVKEVMKIIGASHEELGASVSAAPCFVRIEGPDCVDMQIVDLPGFRDFALDPAKQALADEIFDLVMGFMRDPNNVILCVEQAGDAATMSALQKCREVDPTLQRTILIRNKLDKYYGDLTADNINKWVDGFGDLPEGLQRFAVTLPFWKDGADPDRPLRVITAEKNGQDVNTLKQKGLSDKYVKFIGFNNFVAYLQTRVEKMFVTSITPVLSSLKEYREETVRQKDALLLEGKETDPASMLSTTRDCGVSFAGALSHVMEGVLELEPLINLEDELNEFHSLHKSLGSTHFAALPLEDFCGLDDYIDYLRSEICLPTFDIPVNGGAQFRRLMTEVEIFLRFSEIAVDVKKKDVFQARGVSMSSLTWRDVVVKVLSNEAHKPLLMRIHYVGERIRWFFEKQKQAILNFMVGIEGTPGASLYSPLLPKHAKLIECNEMIKKLVFDTYDATCKRQYLNFVALFDNTLTSTFSNPWVFMKGASMENGEDEDLADCVLPSFEDTQARIPTEMESRSGSEQLLNKWLMEIPTKSTEIDEACDGVQKMVLRTYSFIRSQVCDQVELFAESFFKLPMLRRLEDDMLLIELSEQDITNYEARRDRLEGEIKSAEDKLSDFEGCISKLQNFKIKVEGKLRD